MYNSINKKFSYFQLGLTAIILLFLLGCNLVYGLPQKKLVIQDGLVQDVQVGIQPGSIEKYELSSEQQEMIAKFGYPNRFTISFTKVSVASGQLIDLRQETWYYDAVGYGIVFRNGDKFTETGSSPITAPGLGSTAYHPEDFTQNMFLMEVLAVTGENGYFSEKAQDELLPNGQIVFLKGLGAVFQNGELKYVEMLPLGNAGQASAPAQ